MITARGAVRIREVKKMTNGEAINWIINISADIGKAEHSDLWHYEQALSEIREMLENAQPEHNPDDERKIADLHKIVNWLLSQQKPRWIPCSERLPDKEDVYLCCRTAQDIWILRYMMPYYFREGAFIQFDGDYPVEFSDVIAWMPLPEPYKEDNNE